MKFFLAAILMASLVAISSCEKILGLDTQYDWPSGNDAEKMLDIVSEMDDYIDDEYTNTYPILVGIIEWKKCGNSPNCGASAKRATAQYLGVLALLDTELIQAMKERVEKETGYPLVKFLGW